VSSLFTQESTAEAVTTVIQERKQNMARVHNNIFVRGLSGAVGDQFVIRRTRSGKTIIANKPTFDENREFTESQICQESQDPASVHRNRESDQQHLV
jgi:hypothetical protein